MRNKLDEIIKERLENRLEWRNYLGWLLTHRDLYMNAKKAKFSIGEIVKHKHFNFRGVIYDVDFEFNNSEEWYQSIPKDVRPKKDQPFYLSLIHI